MSAARKELDGRITEELNRLRIRGQAQRLYEAESRPQVEPPELLTLRQRLARPVPDAVWRIVDWLPIDARVILSAQAKAGKTTVLGNLVRSLLDGDLWLGSAKVAPMRRVGIVDAEMSERQLTAWLRDQNIIADDRLTVITLRGRVSSFDILDERIRAEWAERLTGLDYLILDPLRALLDALGLDEKSEAGIFLTAFDALLDEAGVSEAAIAHHMGHHDERSRGDSRLRDWPDVEWRLVKQDPDPASPRFIDAYGRDVEVPESQLEYDPSTRRLTLVGGSRASVSQRRALDAIVEVLENATEGLSGRGIEEALADTDLSRDAIRAGRALGVREGLISISEGKRRAKIHTLSAPVSDSAPPVRQRSGCECASASIDGAHHTQSCEEASARHALTEAGLIDEEAFDLETERIGLF